MKVTNNYRQVLISAVSKTEAEKISDSLLNKKLIAGSFITEGNSKYWWNNKKVSRKYFNISGFTIEKNKTRIIGEVKKIQSDECPIIAFLKIDGNQELLDWITSSIK